jgi:two-component system sensor histidine kinase RpfC
MARTPRDQKTVPAGAKKAATKRACIVAPAGPERTRIIEMLDGWGIEALAVERPLESAALIYDRCVKGEHFDLILFSPDGHGVDAQHYGNLIRSEACTAKARLVHFGEVEHVGTRGNIRRAGFVDFLSEAADKSEIFDVVQEAIGQGNAGGGADVVHLANRRFPRRVAAEQIKVLVASPNIEHQRSARSAFYTGEYRVSEALNGETVLRLCAKQRFDVVLLAMDLENTTASDVVSLLRYSVSPQNLPVFIGLGDPPAGCEDDFAATVDQPIRARTMLAAVRKAIAPREAREPQPQARIPRLDHRTLAKLHQMNPSPEFLPSLIRSFLQQVEQGINELQDCLGTPQGYRRLADFGHDLRDMAGHMGALDLYQMGIVAAHFPEQLFATQGREILGRIEVAYERTREDLQPYLD